MQVVGRVVNIEKDKAYVILVRTSACGGSCKDCGGGCESVEHRIEVLNSINAKAGDLVEVLMDESSGLKASVIIYAIPFMGFVLATYIGYLLKVSEGYVFLMGVLGVAISYIFVHLIDKNNRNKYNIKIKALK